MKTISGLSTVCCHLYKVQQYIKLSNTLFRDISKCRRRQWHPTPVLLPGKSHGRRSLVSCSPWGRWESDTSERLHFHFSLSCIGEGNGNPLQCSCLENPRDGGAWWAAVYGVTQSWTQLKRLSSSSKEKHWKENKNQCNIYLREKVEDWMVGGDGIGERHNKELQYSCQFSIL